MLTNEPTDLSKLFNKVHVITPLKRDPKWNNYHDKDPNLKLKTGKRQFSSDLPTILYYGQSSS
jgi:hypothetical protein